MTRARHVALAAAFALGALALAPPVAAYCRTKACDTDPSYGDVWDEEPQPTECVRDAQGCFMQGTPLYWPSNCLSFAVQRDGSERSDIDYETANSIIELAFDKWASVDCGGGPPSFRSKNLGAIACHKAEYNGSGGNANAFMFRDRDWPYRNAIDTLALTIVTYNVETAEIYDADVEINSAGDTLFTTTDEPPVDAADFEAVITHEVGHFLGLAHSAVRAATMRGTGYEPGTTGLRTLADDDIAGICEIYPPGRRILDVCSPRGGFSSACGSEDEGCAFVAPRRDARSPALTLLSLVALGFAVRRVGRGSARVGRRA